MKQKAYESEPLPISMTTDKYRIGTRDGVYVLDNPRIKRDYVGLKEAVDFIADDNPATKLQQADNAAYIPKQQIRYKVDKEAVIRNKVVPPEDYDKIVDEIVIDISDKSMLSKDEMMILDLIATNNWERPILLGNYGWPKQIPKPCRLFPNGRFWLQAGTNKNAKCTSATGVWKGSYRYYVQQPDEQLQLGKDE